MMEVPTREGATMGPISIFMFIIASILVLFNAIRFLVIPSLSLDGPVFLMLYSGIALVLAIYFEKQEEKE